MPPTGASFQQLSDLLKYVFDDSGALPRDEWCERVRCSKGAISQWVHGNAVPRPRRLARIVEVARDAGVDPAVLDRVREQVRKQIQERLAPAEPPSADSAPAQSPIAVRDVGGNVQPSVAGSGGSGHAVVRTAIEEENPPQRGDLEVLRCLISSAQAASGTATAPIPDEDLRRFVVDVRIQLRDRDFRNKTCATLFSRLPDGTRLGSWSLQKRALIWIGAADPDCKVMVSENGLHSETVDLGLEQSPQKTAETIEKVASRCYHVWFMSRGRDRQDPGEQRAPDRGGREK